MTAVPKPAAVVFDVNETLSDLAPLAGVFADVGLAEGSDRLWFASVLKEGFALTSVGQPASFVGIGREVLRDLMADAGLPPEGHDDAVEVVLAAFLALPVHPDVVPGVRALTEAGIRLATLSNGSAAVAESLLGRAGVRPDFEAVLSVDHAGIWKPARAAYDHAARRLAAAPADLLMVAVHPWDLHGAHLAGLRTAWIRRDPGRAYPAYLPPPDLVVTGVDDLAARLG